MSGRGRPVCTRVWRMRSARFMPGFRSGIIHKRITMRADGIGVPITDEQLLRLQEYLRSERAPPDCMILSQLDGFLTAIAAGPEPVEASEWLPELWGGAPPGFADVEEERAVLTALLLHSSRIGARLDRGVVEPIYLARQGIEPDASWWAAGFLEGIRLRLDAWRPLLRLEGAETLLWPILACASEAVESAPLLELSREQIEEARRDAAIIIPTLVVAINAFWSVADEERRSGRSDGMTSMFYSNAQPYLAPPKVGRNEPCPCGSGKKYKKCCAGAERPDWSSAA
jgi:uncharacterized protein